MIPAKEIDGELWIKASDHHRAIAELESQEPFGYFRYDIRLDAWVQNRDSNKGAAFYTHQPQRKPLTDDQIYEMYNEPRSDAEMLEFARAIEAAHGIKE